MADSLHGKAALPVSEQQQYGKLTYQATPRPGWFAPGAVLQAINTEAQLVDAQRAAIQRRSVRLREGVRSGHMPGAFIFDTLPKAHCQLSSLRLFLTALISIYANPVFVRVVLALPPA